MKTILNKLAEAKKIVKTTSLKKEGHNDFSKYNYFTPEQVETLVSGACEKTGLITKFDLKRNEFGTFGVLTVFELETEQTLFYEMATAIPEIKATNIAQQLGGCVTYTERYLKMSAFGIVENSNDFDDKNNDKPKQEEKPELPWLTDGQKSAIINRIRRKEFTTEQELKENLYSNFRVRKAWWEEMQKELTDSFNQIF